MIKMDEARFLAACGQALEDNRRAGIGTLGEKTLHAALKRYFEPDEHFREVAVGRYVADIMSPGGIIEIQTAGFGRLREKLNEPARNPRFIKTVWGVGYTIEK